MYGSSTTTDAELLSGRAASARRRVAAKRRDCVNASIVLEGERGWAAWGVAPVFCWFKIVVGSVVRVATTSRGARSFVARNLFRGCSYVLVQTVLTY